MEGMVGGDRRDWCDELGDLIEANGGLGGHGRVPTPMSDIAVQLVESGRNPSALKHQCMIFERALAAATKLLNVAAPYICPECGPHVRVDEDECCAMCGADCTLVA